MPSEMAEDAAECFLKWFDDTNTWTAGGEAFTSIAGAFQEWLRDGSGLRHVARDYGIAVETLLVVLTKRSSNGAVPPASPGDEHAWDFITRAGFRYECFLSG